VTATQLLQLEDREAAFDTGEQSAGDHSAAASVWDRTAWRFMLVAVALAPSSLAIGGPDGSFSVGFQSMNNLVDPVLIAIGFAQLGGIVGDVRSVARRAGDRVSAVVSMWMLFVAWCVLAWAVNPRQYGLFLILRLIGVAGMIRLVGRAPFSRRVTVARVLIGTAVLNAVVCTAQLVLGGPVGLFALGEFPDPFQRAGSWRAPTGLSFYPYPLAATALLVLGVVIVIGSAAIGRAWSLYGVGSAGVLIGYSGSVNALLSVGAVLIGAVLWSTANRDRAKSTWLKAIAPFLCVLFISGWAQQSVWLWKGDRTVATEAGNASSGRSGQVRVAAELIGGSPVVGVGVGGYMRARLADPSLDEITTDQQIVHSVPVLLAAEAGLPAIALLLGVIAVAVWRRFRHNALLFAALSGYVLADFMHWYRGVGLVQWGLAFGLCAVAFRTDRRATDRPVESRPRLLGGLQ
jgi:hypothetical protein